MIRSEFREINSGVTIRAGGNIDWEEFLKNDLEPVVRERCPGVAEARRKMEESGALGVGMSGSGPVVFGVFPGMRQAEQVADQLRGNQDWMVSAVEPVDIVKS
jgi:4-diphosphocytidyl-2-C-methyl-D-erythritol kinase